MFLGVASAANRSHLFLVLSLLHVSLIFVVAFGCLELYLLLGFFCVPTPVKSMLDS